MIMQLLNIQVSANAGEVCANAGIVDPLALRNCTYDVTATGDETFVESAKILQLAVIAMPPEERAAETIEPVQASALIPVPASNEGSGLMLPGEFMQRGSRYSMAGHYLTYQQDGNLCLYRTEGDQFVWCINNDPNVQFARSAKVQLTSEGLLLVTDDQGETIWQAPDSAPKVRTGLFVTADGVIQLRAPTGIVVWSSRL